VSDSRRDLGAFGCENSLNPRSCRRFDAFLPLDPKTD